MNKYLKLASVGLTCAAISACDLEQTSFRVLHGSPDAPNVDVLLDDNVVVSAAGYTAASEYINVMEGNRNIKVNVAGTDITAIEANVDFDFKQRKTIIAVNNVSAIEALVLNDSAPHPQKGKVKVRAVHASPNIPEVDIYVTEVGADIATQSPTLSSVPFKAVSDFLQIPGGEYQVRATLAGQAAVAYDSGPVNLEKGLRTTLVALETSYGASPIQLKALTDDGSNSNFDIRDYRSQLRVVHASSDAPAVDILVNDTVVLEDVPFTAASDYLAVMPSTYNVKVNVANTSTTVIEVDPQLMKSTDYTAIALNAVSSIEPLLLEDDNTPPAPGNVKVRLVHGAVLAGTVDVYITAPGADISTLAPTVPNFEFKANTGYLEVPADNYQVRVALAGTKTVAIDTGTLTLNAGQILTAVARDPQPGSSNFGVITF